jgi:hypothetical protein
MSWWRRVSPREPRKAHEKAFALDEVDPFPFFLAETLGGMTVAELKARIGHDELLQWRAYYGWKAWRAEVRA